MKVIQTEDKKQIVAKSNIMVQKSRINLTTVENRIINYMIFLLLMKIALKMILFFPLLLIQQAQMKTLE